MSHLCLITPWVGGGRLEHTWTKSGARWSPALQTAWSPGGEGSWLQNGSTGSGRGYEALAIKFKLRIRHTLPRADSRHQLLIFRLEKPFLTDTGGTAGAHGAPAAPAAPWLSPKGQRQQPSIAVSTIPFPSHGGKGSAWFAVLQQRGPREAVPAPWHGVRAAPVLCCSMPCPTVLTSLVCSPLSASAPVFGHAGSEVSRKEYSISGIACASF